MVGERGYKLDDSFIPTNHPITYSSSPPLVCLPTPICDLASSEWEWNHMTNMAPVSLYLVGG